MFPLYLHDYKITLWWSAKCGCSTIKNIYKNIILQQNDTDLHNDSYFYFDEKYLHYTNILIVRNPIDRFISGYLGFFKTFVNMYQISEDLTFKEYVKLILKYRNNNNLEVSHNISLNHHIVNQFDERFNDLNNYCIKNNINFKFDVIIKLEDFNQSLFLKKYFNIDSIESIDNIILNKNIKTNKQVFVIDYKYDDIIQIFPEYNFFLDNEIIGDIKEIYKDDYKNLKDYNIIY